MDLASKLKLLRSGVKRSTGQLETMKRHVGRAAARAGKRKEDQRLAAEVDDEIKEQMDYVKKIIKTPQYPSEKFQSIHQVWEGRVGFPGISNLLEKHGQLNGYDEEDIDERKEELKTEIQEAYDKLYPDPYPASQGWRQDEKWRAAQRARTIFPDE